MSCTSSPSRRRFPARGAVLIELMVGLTLGLLVVAIGVAATALTLGAAATGRDAADLQERADSALQRIGEQVLQAGTVSATGGAAPRSMRFSRLFDGWNGGGSAVGGLEGVAGKPDTLRVSREPFYDEHDCLGNSALAKPPSTAVPTRLDAEFYIQPDARDSNRPALYCRGVQWTSSTSVQAVVAGVDDLQLRYRIRDADGLRRYVTADALDPSTPVEAVQVCLQLSSEGRHGAAGLLGCDGQPITAKIAAGRMVRVVRGVFKVRNGPG